MTSVGYGEEKIRCANLKGKRVASNNNIFIGNGISDKSCINYDNSPSVEFSEDEIECNLFVLFQAFLEQTAQARSDLGMRGGFFSRLHPVCVAPLILVHEPQSDVAAIVSCFEVHAQAASNVQLREPRQERR